MPKYTMWPTDTVMPGATSWITTTSDGQRMRFTRDDKGAADVYEDVELSEKEAYDLVKRAGWALDPCPVEATKTKKGKE